MKVFSITLALTAFAFVRAQAQVSVQVVMTKDEYLPSESIPLAVKITNRSGQELHLGADPDWLTFSVESADGFVVIKNSDVPVVDPFDLESSQMAIKRVDIQPYFVMSRPGRYKVTATIRIKEWGASLSSAPKQFDIINGVDLWTQDFGVPTTNNVAPEVRRYMLEQGNFLHSQLRLYVQVSDSTESRIYKVSQLGPMVSFSQPEAQVDRNSNLNVLWQAGAQAFDYCIVSPNGTVVKHDIYDYYNTRPRLGVDINGNVVVIGGVRRSQPADLPAVAAPGELTPPDRSNP